MILFSMKKYNHKINIDCINIKLHMAVTYGDHDIHAFVLNQQVVQQAIYIYISHLYISIGSNI